MEKRSVFIQEIYTECEINAPAGDVYSIIADFGNYPLWTSELTIIGDTRPEGRMRVQVKTAGDGKGWYKLSSKMVRNDERMIAFNNCLILPFILCGRHRFEIVPLSKERTRFINAEVFSGLSVPFIRRRNLLLNTRRFKENINRALKNKVEKPAI